MRIAMLGRPGCGKGTQIERIAGTFGFEVLATSALLRARAGDGTPGGRRIELAMRSGELVADDIVVPVVADAVRRARGPVLLDGFPRTLAQRDALARLLPGDGLDLVIELAVPSAEVLARLRRRRVCTACGTPVRADRCPACGAAAGSRPDDTPDVVLRRLWTYELETRPVLEWFERRGLLLSVDGTGPVEQVTERLLDALAVRTGAVPGSLAMS